MVTYMESYSRLEAELEGTVFLFCDRFALNEARDLINDLVGEIIDGADRERLRYWIRRFDDVIQEG